MRRQQRREESIVLHKIKRRAIQAFSIVVAVYVLIFLVNLLCPHSWRWLEQEELDSMKELVISILTGIASGMVSAYFWGRQG